MPTTRNHNAVRAVGETNQLRLAWVFTTSEGVGAFPCGVWLDRAGAERWIESVGASGTLSAYVVDESAYDSNVRLARLSAESEERRSAEFKRRYTTAIDHAHFQNGECV